MRVSWLGRQRGAQRWEARGSEALAPSEKLWVQRRRKGERAEAVCLNISPLLLIAVVGELYPPQLGGGTSKFTWQGGTAFKHMSSTRSSGALLHHSFPLKSFEELVRVYVTRREWGWREGEEGGIFLFPAALSLELIWGIRPLVSGLHTPLVMCGQWQCLDLAVEDGSVLSVTWGSGW